MLPMCNLLPKLLQKRKESHCKLTGWKEVRELLSEEERIVHSRLQKKRESWLELHKEICTYQGFQKRKDARTMLPEEVERAWIAEEAGECSH